MQISSNNGARNRLFGVLGGLSGALGMVAYAGAAHGGGAYLGTTAPLLLGHAPVLLVLSLIAPGNRAAQIGGALIIVGLVLFCGDLEMRDLNGDRLFPFAAPTGGTAMILGWLSVALAGFFPHKK